MTYSVVNPNNFSQIFPTLNPKEYPQTLQYEGNSKHIFTQSPKIAVVGSRNITPYGKKILTQIIPDLCHQGFTIVSGGAFGVDILSQKIASNFTDQIITILGSGLNHKVPKTNQPIYQKILQAGGTLVSPYSENLHPTKYTFVQRNQVIASIADLVLVIEAGAKSGSLHTANYASEQGIPVACFPGSIYQELSQGTNQLIQKGAHLVQSTQEIISLIPNHKLQKLKPKSTINKPHSQPDIFQQIYDLAN